MKPGWVGCITGLVLGAPLWLAVGAAMASPKICRRRSAAIRAAFPDDRDEGDELAASAEAGARVTHDDPRWAA